MLAARAGGSQEHYPTAPGKLLECLSEGCKVCLGAWWQGSHCVLHNYFSTFAYETLGNCFLRKHHVVDSYVFLMLCHPQILSDSTAAFWIISYFCLCTDVIFLDDRYNHSYSKTFFFFWEKEPWGPVWPFIYKQGEYIYICVYIFL